MLNFWWALWIGTVLGSPVLAIVLSTKAQYEGHNILIGGGILIAGFVLHLIATHRIAHLVFECSQKNEGWRDPEHADDWKKSRRLKLLLLFGGWFVMLGTFFFGCMGAIMKGL